MVGTRLHIVAVDPGTGEIVSHCPGPDPRGACRHIELGATVPCVGRELSVGEIGDEDAYLVPPGMSLCPVTLALAMDVPMGRPQHHPATVSAN